MASGLIGIIGERRKEISLSALALIIIAPVLYYRTPAFFSSPDILYVQGKVMQVLKGRIFADPITGFDTMHPPLFHLFLAPFKALGLGPDFGLIIVTIFNVALLIFFTFKVVETVFDRTTGFCTALMIPFIIEFMGCRNILLATSFYFSLPFYLAGLWLYFKSDKSIRLSAGAAVLWGLAFIISPVYLFLLGLTFLYELIIKRNYRRFFVMAAAFSIAIIPFFIQAFYIYSQDLWGSRVFAFWRGIPGFGWWGELVVEFISPTKSELIALPSAIHLFILLTALVMIIRARKLHWYILLSLLAYFLTFYHFSDQYAIRIQVLFSIFLVASTIFGIRNVRLNKYLWIIPTGAIVIFSLYNHYSMTISTFKHERVGYETYLSMREEFWSNMGKYLKEDRYIFCNKDVYLKFIMPHFPAYSLGAYKTMDYFQLKAEISDSLDKDYWTAIKSTDYAVIDSIAIKYNIETAVATRYEIGAPLLETLVEHWEPVYRGKQFVILKKPDVPKLTLDQEPEGF